MLINQLVKYNSIDLRLNKLFAALADPTRRSILGQLSRGEVSVNDLAKPYSMSVPAISKHLKVLEQAGLISKTKKAQWRQCRLEVDSLKEAAQWLEKQQMLWENNLDNLDNYLKKVQSTNKDKE